MKLNELAAPPPGTYAAVRFDAESKKRVTDFAKSIGVECLPMEDMHCTIIYSTKGDPSFKARGKLDKPMEMKGKSLTVFNQRNGKKALVLLLDCPEIEARHEELMSTHDFVYDFPQYQPHISLNYDFQGNLEDLKDAKLPTLNAVEEYQEELNMNWAEDKAKG